MAEITDCAVCGYPIKIQEIGEQVVCANCGTRLEAIQGVSIPTPLFAGGLGFFLGMLFGGALKGATERGQRLLEAKARG